MMSNNNGNNNNSGGGDFFKGLLWGALIGGAAVYFLGTKRGKKLLKTITEGELEGVSGIEELLEDDYEEEYPVRSVEEIKPQTKTAPVKTEEPEPVSPQSNGEAKISAIKKLASTGHRFFRKIPKRK